MTITPDQVCAYLIVIRRSGKDGPSFPLIRGSACSLGRDADCDIRIQNEHISKVQCLLVNDKQDEIWLKEMSTTTQTRLNEQPIKEQVLLQSGDILQLHNRSFRYEKRMSIVGVLVVCSVCSTTVSRALLLTHVFAVCHFVLVVYSGQGAL
jgi:FHA domain